MRKEKQRRESEREGGGCRGGGRGVEWSIQVIFLLGELYPFIMAPLAWFLSGAGCKLTASHMLLQWSCWPTPRRVTSHSSTRAVPHKTVQRANSSVHMHGSAQLRSTHPKGDTLGCPAKIYGKWRTYSSLRVFFLSAFFFLLIPALYM